MSLLRGKTRSVRRRPAAAARAPREPPSEVPGPWTPSVHAPGLDRSATRRSVRELSWSHLDEMVGELASGMRGAARPQVVVGVAHGGVFVGGALARALGCNFVPVRITRRSRDTGARGGPKAPRMLGHMPRELRGQRVLVVDDVAASGDTLELARNLARKAGARQVLTAALLRREEGYAPDWSVLKTDELVIFPWDYQPLVEDERFEGKP